MVRALALPLAPVEYIGAVAALVDKEAGIVALTARRVCWSWRCGRCDGHGHWVCLSLHESWGDLRAGALHDIGNMTVRSLCSDSVQRRVSGVFQVTARTVPANAHR